MTIISPTTLILKRSWNLWVLFAVLLIIGIFTWAAKLNVTPDSQHLYFYGRKAQTLGLAAPFVVALAIVYDLYLRLVRRTRLEFSETGIADYASSARLGEIRWEAVDSITFKRQWLGAVFIINFKRGVRINDRVESWDKLIVDSLAVTDGDSAKIGALLASHKILGGQDLS